MVKRQGVFTYKGKASVVFERVRQLALVQGDKTIKELLTGRKK